MIRAEMIADVRERARWVHRRNRQWGNQLDAAADMLEADGAQIDRLDLQLEVATKDANAHFIGLAFSVIAQRDALRALIREVVAHDEMLPDDLWARLTEAAK